MSALIDIEVLKSLVAQHQPAHVGHDQTPTGDTEAACSCGETLAIPRTDRAPAQLSGAAKLKIRPRPPGAKI